MPFRISDYRAELSPTTSASDATTSAGNVNDILSAEITRLRAERDALRAALSNLVDTVDTAVEADLFRSVDGNRPEVQAMRQARIALRQGD